MTLDATRRDLVALGAVLGAAGLGGLAAAIPIAIGLVVVACVVLIIALVRTDPTPVAESATLAAAGIDAVHATRAALVEQLENCRAWHSRDPARGEPAWARLRGARPRLDALAEVVDRLDLQPDLAALLIWQTATIRELWPRVDDDLDALFRTGKGPPSPDRQVELGNLWMVMIERLQVAAALVAAEARRRGIDDIASLHDGVAWTVVPRRPDRWREMMAIADRHDGIPRFPADSAFDDVRPEARDLAGAATGARQQADLNDALSPRARRILRR